MQTDAARRPSPAHVIGSIGIDPETVLESFRISVIESKPCSVCYRKDSSAEYASQTALTVPQKQLGFSSLHAGAQLGLDSRHKITKNTETCGSY